MFPDAPVDSLDQEDTLGGLSSTITYARTKTFVESEPPARSSAASATSPRKSYLDEKPSYSSTSRYGDKSSPSTFAFFFLLFFFFFFFFFFFLLWRSFLTFFFVGTVTTICLPACLALRNLLLILLLQLQLRVTVVIATRVPQRRPRLLTRRTTAYDLFFFFFFFRPFLSHAGLLADDNDFFCGR